MLQCILWYSFVRALDFLAKQSVASYELFMVQSIDNLDFLEMGSIGSSEHFLLV